MVATASTEYSIGWRLRLLRYRDILGTKSKARFPLPELTARQLG